MRRVQALSQLDLDTSTFMTISKEVTRRSIKYVFVDVVAFSKRSAEAQSDIVESFNGIIHGILDSLGLTLETDRILIPTGDGMCIALFGSNIHFDTHVQIAVNILKDVASHNSSTSDENRRFEVRIGINQNTDILVIDINGRQNVAGAGINLASRVMDKADGGQILVSAAAHHELQPSEMYMDQFRMYPATAKHGISFPVYQYINEQIEGINVDTPTFRVAPAPTVERLPKETAYYFAVALKQRRQLLNNRKKKGQYSLSRPVNIVLMGLLARDYYDLAKATELEPDEHRFTKGFNSMSFEEQLNYYDSQDTWVTGLAEQAVIMLSGYYGLQLGKFSYCFERGEYSVHYDFVNEKGIEKLKTEWPIIWDEFDLDSIIGHEEE